MMDFDAMQDYLLACGDEPKEMTLEESLALSVNDLLALRGILSRKPTDEPQEDANAEPHGTGLTIEDMGWTREQAAIVRGQFGAMAQDWDDPAMDVYDNLPNDSGEDANAE